MIVDANAVIAAIFPEQNQHEQCVRALTEADQRVLSPFVVAEIDYFILQYRDVETELLFLQELAAGAYELALFSEYDVAVAQAVVEQYQALRIGLADASIVVLAERYSTRDILTLDERHSRAMRPLSGRRSFRLLPADA